MIVFGIGFWGIWVFLELKTGDERSIQIIRSLSKVTGQMGYHAILFLGGAIIVLMLTFISQWTWTGVSALGVCLSLVLTSAVLLTLGGWPIWNAWNAPEVEKE